MERRHLFGTTLGIVGILLAAIQVLHATQQTQVPIAIVVDGGPFALLGLALAFTGYWLATTPAFEPDLERIGAWTIGGTILFASIAALMLFSQRVATGSLERAAYFTTDSVTIGTIAGTLVGLYDARSQRHQRELERERDRTEAFARKAADLNNYGRALAQATGVEEVSAYCIEGISSLLSYDQTAFVEVEDGTATIVSNTISAVPEADVRSVATNAAVASEIVELGHREAFPADAGAVLTVKLENTSPATGILVSIDGPDPLPTEDEQLLEMLVSHASMVLDRLYRTETATE